MNANPVRTAFKFFLMALAIFSFSTLTTQAQDPYVCDPGDCIPALTWNPINSFLYFSGNYNGCDYEVLYRVREGNCSGVQQYDIQIVTITLADDPACVGIDIPSMLKIAVEEILGANPMSWPYPASPACLVGVRVYMSGCWQRLDNPPHFPAASMLIPCFESTCCTFNYRVCNSGTQIIVDDITPGICPPGQPAGCVSVCL